MDSPLRWPRARKDLQPERFEQGHADDVLAFVTHFNVFQENPLQLEAKSAVEIDIVNIDVARVDVNLVQVQDQEGVVEKTEGGPFANTLALQPGVAHQLFHLQFAGQRIDVLATDDSDSSFIVIDPEVFARRMGEVSLQIGFLLRERRHEALTECGISQPLDHFGDERRLQGPEYYMLNGQLPAL